MKAKHVTRASICTSVLLIAGAGAATAPLQRPADKVALEFLTAFGNCAKLHKVAACSGLVADDAVLLSDHGEASNREDFMRVMVPPNEPKRAGVERRYSDPIDLKAWRAGGMLFFTYRTVWTEMYGDQPYRSEVRATFVLRESPSGVKLELCQGTPIPNTQRQPALVDPASYDQYVGEYSAGPGDQELVTREGGKLFLSYNGDRSELLPGRFGAFYIYGTTDDWFFMKDAQGNVTGLESRLWGQDILARRVH